MKNSRDFYLKIFSLFGGEIFYIFDYACFRNEQQQKQCHIEMTERGV